MAAVDLDAVDRHIEPFNGCPECKVREMVAELRAARKLRSAVIKLHDDYDGPDYELRGTLARILLAHDRAVGTVGGGGR